MERIDTKIWHLNPSALDMRLINQAAAIIKRGGLVAFPTETVYGLGANGLDGKAVADIYRAKGRPSDNPLILHVADTNMVRELSKNLPPKATLLMKKFWPGPLTLVVPRASHIPREVTGGLATVAVRMPHHPVALALIKASGVPIAAPSANKSGRPSPTNAEHVKLDLQGCIDAILDGGPAGLGLESTVLDLTGAAPVILRPGGVTYEQLLEALGDVTIDPSALGERLSKDKAPRSPGMKYKHYAPAAPLILFEGEPEKVKAAIVERAEELLKGGKRVGILATEEHAQDYPPDSKILKIGSRKNPAGVAAMLFKRLREFDQLQVDVILTEGFETKGIGLAVMNRLRRAAGERIEC
ncbi:translation factor SUA5 [Desulforamulus reducens MI-1]|uniref:Threonylcarbamoyl-AMP synthase n=1 Tax=Desulforamulus reducens (strain ATCC BAA-1160 / DSM 100696 / MI-1) TaxID=349161 RepID=A4J9B5_DESRM|nr:L-threonylcarbamoyladenylate synthase [Desulforamulus reducens]ABO51668.1 translation factor SUA5 [Desulforamulus reducens MI-1]